MEAIDDGHRFRLAYLHKHWDTAKMHHGDSFALDVVRERYFRHDTENLGSPEFSELLQLYKDRVYDADIASAAKTTARQRFGGALRRNDRDREGGGGSLENIKTTRPVLNLLMTTSLTGISTYSNYEGKIRLFAELFCIDEEGIFIPPGLHRGYCIRYLA
eukprot:jgi/Tetstr1/455352/TSEL_042187.t1